MDSWTFNRECERVGLDPARVRRVLDAIQRSGGTEDIIPGYEKELLAYAEGEREKGAEEAAETAEHQHNDRVAKAHTILNRKGPTDPHNAIRLAFAALRGNSADYPETTELLQLCIDDLDNTNHARAVSFPEYVAARIGARKWKVCTRLTSRDVRDGRARITPKRYAELQAEHAAALAPRAAPMVDSETKTAGPSR